MAKKNVFHKPTVLEIKSGRKPVIVEAKGMKDVREARDSVNPKREYLVIATPSMIPEIFHYVSRKRRDDRLTRSQASRKFMKHGPEVFFPRYQSLDSALRAMQKRRKVPVNIREEKFDKSKGPFCCYSYKPFTGPDKRTRKVPLIEVVEGARLYAYTCRVPGTAITLDLKIDAARVEKDGGTIMCTVPSRTPKDKRYGPFRISGIAIADNDEKYAIANMLSTSHTCPHTEFMLRYTYGDERKSSEVVNWDAHSIAVYYAILDHFLNEEKNFIPLAMAQIPLPSQKMVDLYEFYRNNALILTKENEEDPEAKPFALNDAELEMLLHDDVQEFGHDETLYCHHTKDGHLRDGYLRDYQWATM